MAAADHHVDSPAASQQQQDRPDLQLNPQPAGAGLSRWMPTLTSMGLNALNPFARPESTRPVSDPPKHASDNSNAGSPKGRSLFSNLNPLATNDNAAPTSRDASPARSTTMFAEPDSRSTSEDGESTLGERRRSKRSNKPKTAYSVCHPPPASLARAKMHRRPRSLLQLHRLRPNQRPVPAFEVVPSANFNVRLTKSLTKVFRAKHGLCQNDFVVLRAEKYLTVDDDPDEEQEAQDIIGLTCNRQRKDNKDEQPADAPRRTRICMASGVEWEAYLAANGGYEFSRTDEHGLAQKVRWVPKREADGRKALSKDGTMRFNFSTISPNSRRHPVIASLSKTGLDIYDSYKVPDASTPAATPSRREASSLETAVEDEGTACKDLVPTDEALRETILMTSVWVMFKEGWSPSFKCDEASPTMRSARSMSQISPVKTPILDPSTPPASPRLEKRASIRSVSSSVLRRSSLLAKGHRGSQASVPEEALPDAARNRSSCNNNSNRAKGDGIGTTLVQRAASTRRQNNQGATWRPEPLATQSPLSETSREDLDTTPRRATESKKDAWDSPATPKENRKRKGSIAEPVLTRGDPDVPDPTGSPTPAPSGTVRRRPRSMENEKAESVKRVSDATTTTASAASGRAAAQSMGSKSRRKSGLLKRIFMCGHHDV